MQLADHAEFVGTGFVHPDFFQVFGVAPVSGRLFDREDAERSAVVSLSFAERNFGGALPALGRPVFLESRSYEIVGVMPAAMRFPASTDVCAAASVEPANRNRSGHNYRAVGRLAPGVSVESANARLSTLAGQLARAFPDSNGRKTFVATPLRDDLVSRVRATLFVVMGAVALVLLIACANVANLVLARASGRSRELAVRAALGAGRRRIVGQLLAESLLLALMAGAVGLLLARLGTDALLRVGSRYVPLPRLDDVHTDWRVLAFTAVVSLITAVAFGLVPAVQASRLDVSGALNRTGSRGTLGTGSPSLRNGLVVAQVALSLMLAIDAGLLLRSFAALTNMPLGFRPEGVVVAYAHAPARGSLYDKSGLDNYLRAGQLFDDVFARLQRIPGVVSSAGAMGLPTGQYDSDGSHAVEGKVDQPDKWMTIVGVVGDVRQASPASPPGPELYMPLRQHPYAANEVQIVVRTSVPPESLIGEVREAVRSMSPEVAMKFTTLEASVGDSIAAPRFRMALVSSFATLALMLAVAGMYAVMSYGTSRRTSEFGLRMALGAKVGDVVGLVLRGAAGLLATGAALGLVLAMATSRILTAMLFGVEPMDARTYAIVLLVAIPLVVLAATVPAMRAARVDPMIALREP